MDPGLHDIAKEVIGALMVWAATRLASKVSRFAKDLNCYFARTRELELRLNKLEGKSGEKEHECS